MDTWKRASKDVKINRRTHGPSTGVKKSSGVEPIAASVLRQQAPHRSSEENAAVALRQFRMVFSTVRSHFQRVEQQAGIGGAQLWALGAIAMHPGIGVNELAGLMDVRQPTASNLVRALVNAGWVESRRAEHDRRLVQLNATKPGHAVLKKAPGPYSGVLPAALQEMPPGELQQLTRCMAVLIEILGADERSAVRPLAHL